MTTYWLQSAALMAAAYLLGAAIACMVRRMFFADTLSEPASTASVRDAAVTAAVPAAAVARVATTQRGPMIEAERRPDVRPAPAPIVERAATPPPMPVQPPPTPVRPIVPEMPRPVVTAPVAPGVPRPGVTASVVSAPVAPEVQRPWMPTPVMAEAPRPVVSAPVMAEAPRPVVSAPVMAEAVRPVLAKPDVQATRPAVTVPVAETPIVVERPVSMPSAAQAVTPAFVPSPTPVVPARSDYSPVAAATAAAAATIAATVAARQGGASTVSDALAAARQTVAGVPQADATLAPAVTAPAAKAPAGATDDLTLIRSIDPDLQQRLRGLGIQNFETIARWRPVDVTSIAEKLGLRGRVDSESWIEQAQILAKGEATDYSRRASASLTPSAAIAAGGQAVGAAPPVEPASPTSATAATDDLTRIRGIDADLQQRLRGLGVQRFESIARWRPVDVSTLSDKLGFKGRIERDNWIEQAQILAKGEATDYSRRAFGGGQQAATAASLIERAAGAITSPGTYTSLPTAAAALPSPVTARAAPDSGKPGAVDQAISRVAGDVQRSGAQAAAAAASAVAAATASVSGAALAASGRATDRVAPGIESASGRTAADEPARSQPRSDLAGLRSVRSEHLRRSEGNGDPRQSPVYDDLKRIRGIGVLNEKKLNSLGISSYEQIANWTDADINRISQQLDFKGRVEREHWVEQARILATGGQTDFSLRMDSGEL